MDSILIMKTGETFVELRKRLGNFEDWIVRAHLNERQPAADDLSGRFLDSRRFYEI